MAPHDYHKEKAEAALNRLDPRQGLELEAAQVHAILHLAEKVEGVAVVLEYIDVKLERG